MCGPQERDRIVCENLAAGNRSTLRKANGGGDRKKKSVRLESKYTLLCTTTPLYNYSLGRVELWKLIPEI